MFKQEGFTLVELLIVSLLLSVISLTAYGGLAGGVRIWRRVEASVGELDLVLGEKRFRKDLVNRVPFGGIGFTGDSGQVSFPALVTVGAGEAVHQEVGRVRYLFDEPDHRLCREEMTYASVVAGAETDCRPVISSVEKLSFKYYNPEGGWLSGWAETTPPLAVRMEATIKRTGSEGEITKQFTVALP